MKYLNIPISILSMLFLLVTHGWTEELNFRCDSAVSVPNVIGNIQNSYNRITSISSNFTQSSYLAALDMSEISKGKMWFKRPGMMRWSYSEPEEQEFVIRDGKFWFYQILDSQVTIDQFESVMISELPLAFLMGMGNLANDFSLQKSCREGEKLIVVLKPKIAPSAEGAMELFSLLVDSVTYDLLGAEVSHLGGNRTTLYLINPEFNKVDKTDIFELNIPSGVDVIDRTK